MRKAYVFLKRGWITFTSYKMQVIIQYGSLLLMVAIFYFVAEMIRGVQVPSLTKYGGDYTSFIVVGVVFQWFVAVSLNSFSSSIRSEQTMGTLEFLLMSRTPLSAVLFYSAVWNFTRVLLNTLVVFLLCMVIFNIHFTLNLLLALLLLLLTVTALSGIGMISAGMILAFKQGDPINWLFVTFTGLLSGVFFPVEVLPPMLKSVAFVLPTTYALVALRETLILNASLSSVSLHVAVMALFSLLTVPVGFVLFRWGFNKARVAGSLAEY